MEKIIKRLAASASNNISNLFSLFKYHFPESTLDLKEFQYEIERHRKDFPYKFHNNNALSDLRSLMRKQEIDCVIFSTADEFTNEYTQRIKYLTNFSGSLALCIVTLYKAVIFVDGRYTLQVQAEVDNTKFDICDYSMLSFRNWVLKNVKSSSVVGLISTTTSIYENSIVEKIFSGITNNYLYTTEHVVDDIWLEKPSVPVSNLEIHDIKYCGKEYTDKIADVSLHLKDHNAKAMLITKGDEISWLLNIRSEDVKNNPIVLAYCLITSNKEVLLFIDDLQITEEIKNYFDPFVKCIPIKNIEQALSNLELRGKVLIADHSPIYFLHLLKGLSLEVEVKPSYIALSKSIKNMTEQEGARDAHIKDAVANIKFYYEVFNNIDKNNYTELSLDTLLKSYRAKAPTYRGDSFDTIVGINDNGAIVHYKSKPSTNKKLTSKDYLLLDSGGQYVNGTTDLTRTISFGEPSLDFKQKFTMVLKGHIALANAKFPKRTKASALDSLARQFLWNVGVNYEHGTGHGVGVYSCVHEGPISISPACHIPFEEGMIVSNEPGYYKEGEYGIRLENLYITKSSSIDGYYEFENLTFVPFDSKSIDISLLSNEEYNWLVNYHSEIYEKISIYLTEQEKIWLKDYIKLS